MTYEKMTGAIDLEALEVQAEEVTEVSAAGVCTLISGNLRLAAFYGFCNE